MKITAKSPRTKNYMAELRRPFAAFILNPNFTNKMLQLIITKKTLALQNAMACLKCIVVLSIIIET